MVLSSLDRLSYIHCCIKRVSSEQELQAALFCITGTRTLVLASTNIKLIAE